MCLLVTDMLEYVPVGRGEMKSSLGQAHKLRLCFTSTTGLCLAVYLAVPKRSQFCVLQLVANENSRYSLEHISTLFSTQVRIGRVSVRYVTMWVLMMEITVKQETLVDFVLTATEVWGLWLDDDNQTVVKYVSFEQ